MKNTGPILFNINEDLNFSSNSEIINFKHSHYTKIKAKKMIPIFRHALILALVIGLNSCTQEMQNKISRSIQNYTGTNGVLDVINNGKIMYRFIKIDKMSTATSSDGQNVARTYRFGYGYLDQNQNYHVDDNEKKTYFEVSDYSTAYVFYENPFED